MVYITFIGSVISAFCAGWFARAVYGQWKARRDEQK